MRKTFQLRPEGKHPDRVLEALKHEVRKYIARERRRTLPEGVDYWDFDCRAGATQEEAQPVHVAELIGQIDAVAKAGTPQVYVEVLAKHGHRTRRE
ncbi:MAG TPA: DUF6172 family protein [Variovorax sp.]|nr:DUF6172 family protein [Variovorax sp.]